MDKMMANVITLAEVRFIHPPGKTAEAYPLDNRNVIYNENPEPALTLFTQF
jgi:hypothetical protein